MSPFPKNEPEVVPLSPENPEQLSFPFCAISPFDGAIIARTILQEHPDGLAILSGHAGRQTFNSSNSRWKTADGGKHFSKLIRSFPRGNHSAISSAAEPAQSPPLGILCHSDVGSNQWQNLIGKKASVSCVHCFILDRSIVVLLSTQD